jgi:hypothetical protein
MTTAGLCEVCGEPIVAGVQFCTSCGAYQGWTERTPDAAEAAAPPTARDESATARDLGPGESVATLVPPDDAEHADRRTLEHQPVAATATRTVRERACPRCGTGNEPARRFCRKCGYLFGEPHVVRGATLAATSRLPWWRRWFSRRTPAERQAHKSYRRSLPLWIRLRRYVAVLAALAVVFLYFRVVGRDPVAWAQHTLDAIRGTLVPVAAVQAASDPPSQAVKGYPPRAATDGRIDTAWATVLLAGSRPIGSPCAAAGQQSALLLTTPKPLTVRGLEIRAGLDASNPQRLQFWRPRVLDLSFSDGTCQRVVLKDSPGWQRVSLHPVKTSAARIAVVAGFAPQGGGTSRLVQITEIRLLQRPN